MKSHTKKDSSLMTKVIPFRKTAVVAMLLAAQPAFALDAPKVSGVLEVEVSSSQDFTNAKTSDIALATTALTFEGNVNKNVNYNVSFLYEEGDTPLELDEGFITINIPRTSSYFSAGQLILPFGNYSTAMVSDPLTLEIGETRESVLQFGFETDMTYGSIYTFNGSVDKAGSSDTISDMGANAGFKFKWGNTEMDFGIGYISDLAESDGISGSLADPISRQETVAGITAHAVMNFGSFQAVAEYLDSASSFNVADLAFNGAGADPSAHNIELSYNGDMTVGVSYQGTTEALALGLPKSKVLVAVSMDLFENTNMALEFSSATDYSVANGGTGNSADAAVLKLAVEF